MCLAIYKPAGLDIPEKNLKSGFDANNDGCGIAWAQDGQIHVEKGLMTWDAFYGIYQGVSEYPCLIHFRKATHGKKNDENCHPFIFNNGKHALIHNGVIPIKCTESDYSDTWHFVNKVLDPLIKQGVSVSDQSLSWFVRVSIGTDKIVVMDGNGAVVIFNEDKGNWEDTDGPEGKSGKVWYSNYSFRGSSTTTNWRNNTNYSSTGYGSTGGNGMHQSYPRVEDDDENANVSGNDWEGYGHHSSSATNGNKSTEIADDASRKPGCMTEYGWYDSEIEAEIDRVRGSTSMSREDAIIQVFNNA